MSRLKTSCGLTMVKMPMQSFRFPVGRYFATDGHCTHEEAHLADGLVDEYEIECPRHSGNFDYRTGMATVAPACETLKTHPVEVDDGKVYLLA